MKSLLERFRSWPRAVRWLTIFAAVLGGYFAVVEPVVAVIAGLNAKVESRLDQLAAARRDRGEITAAEDDVKLGVQRFGTVLLPGLAQDRSEAVSRRIAQVMQAHNVRGVTTTVKESALPSTALARELAATLGAETRIDRMITELQFESSPETVAAVLADLERSPEITAVSRVQVRSVSGGGAPAPARAVKATIAAEAWIAGKKGRPR